MENILNSTRVSLTPSSLSLLLHACKAVLDPGASCSRIPAHHAGDGDGDGIPAHHAGGWLVKSTIYCKDFAEVSGAVCLHVLSNDTDHARAVRTDRVLITHAGGRVDGKNHIVLDELEGQLAFGNTSMQP